MGFVVIMMRHDGAFSTLLVKMFEKCMPHTELCHTSLIGKSMDA